MARAVIRLDPANTPDKPLGKKYAKWLDIYVQTGDQILATKTVYPNVGKNAKDVHKVILSRAHQIKAQVAPSLYARIRRRFLDESVGKVNTLSKLAEEAENENVRRLAAIDWLDRAGLTVTKDSQALPTISITINRGMDDAIVINQLPDAAE